MSYWTQRRQARACVARNIASIENLINQGESTETGSEYGSTVINVPGRRAMEISEDHTPILAVSENATIGLSTSSDTAGNIGISQVDTEKHANEGLEQLAELASRYNESCRSLDEDDSYLSESDSGQSDDDARELLAEWALAKRVLSNPLLKVVITILA